MEKYDYLTEETNDVLTYIKDELDEDTKQALLDNDEEAISDLNDRLWVKDSITGNGSGSYTFNAVKAEENLAGNLDLLADALEAYGETSEAFDYLRSPENADVTIRCYLLSQAVDDAVEQFQDQLLINTDCNEKIRTNR